MEAILAHVGGGTFAPLQLAPALLAAVLYALRVRTLDGTPRAVPGWRQACFLGGCALIVVVLVSPVSHISDELFLAHMVEHLLIADFATLLLVLGLTGPVIAPIMRLPGLGVIRVLGHPLVALPLWALDFYVWHIPALQTAAIDHSAVHALQHAMFIFFGANMWMPLFGPLPKPQWFTGAWQVAYIVVVRLLGAILGNVLVWSGTIFYPVYARGEASWDIGPLADQQTAGAIMMVEGSLLTLGLFAYLFLRWMREGQEKQELVEYAQARGVELTSERAGRAVTAGRGDELRTRIEREAAAGPAPPREPASAD
jgi:putative membrane protein